MSSESREEVLRRAEKFGIDLTLLYEQLKLTPTQRLETHKQFLRSIESFEREVERDRARTRSQGSLRKQR